MIEYVGTHNLNHTQCPSRVWVFKQGETLRYYCSVSEQFVNDDPKYFLSSTSDDDWMIVNVGGVPMVFY